MTFPYRSGEDGENKIGHPVVSGFRRPTETQSHENLYRHAIRDNGGRWPILLRCDVRSKGLAFHFPSFPGPLVNESLRP
jgi:hypothetical protein